MSTDPADEPLRPQEALDSDEIRNDDGDEVVDPPDQWLDPDDDETLDERLAAEEPDVGVDTPLSDAVDRPDGVSSSDYAVKHAEVIDGVVVEDSRTDRGQIAGTPEDGDSFFTIVK